MSVLTRFASVFRSRKLDRDLEDELRSHLDMRTQDNLEAGMSEEEARLDAQRRFGDQVLIRERTRSAHIAVWLESVLQDLRYGLRTLHKSPAFTLVAALSLALGIGINTAVFSLIDTLLFREVRLVDPARLVSLYRFSAKGVTQGWFPIPVFRELRDSNHVFAGTAAWTVSHFSARVNGEPPRMVSGGFYSDNYYQLLGVRPWLGRTFTPQDDQPSAPPVAMISYDFWRNEFGGSRAALGRTINAKGIAFQVVGVVPPGFTGLTVLDKPPDIALPLTWYPSLKLNDDDLSADIVARLNPATALEQATAEANLVFHRIPPELLAPDWTEAVKRGLLSESIELHPRGRGDEWGWREYKLHLSLLMGVVGLVLLIACANIANLLLARAAARRKEIAIRLAIGAARWRVIRQLLTESFLLAGLGSAAGLWMALLAHRALLRVLGLEGDFTLDWRVLIFTAGIGLIAGAFFGLVPAFRGTRLDPGSSLKGDNRQDPTSLLKSKFATGKALVVLQVALSLMLVVGTGLLVQTLRNLSRVDPGFDRDNVLLFWIFPTTAGYQGINEVRLYDDYLRRFNSIPGVVKASMSRHYMMQRASDFVRVSVSQAQGTQDPDSLAAFNVVAPEFFSTMRIPLLAGRDFSANDTANSAKTAIVDQKFAGSHFPNENPLGQHILLHTAKGGVEVEIVGVVRDLHYYSVRPASDMPSQEIFVPYTQAAADRLGQMCFAVRTASKPTSMISSVRREAQAVDKDLAIVSPFTQAAVVDQSTIQEHSLAVLTVLFSGLALLLACIGLYGVMAHTVSWRTHEIGIRMALGAARTRIRRMVLRESGLLVGLGIAAGIPAALAANQFIRNILYDVRPSEVSIFLLGIMLLVGVAGMAAYLPARRASQVDPVIALRNDG